MPYANFEGDTDRLLKRINELVEISKAFDEDKIRFEFAATVLMVQSLDPALATLIEVFVAGMTKAKADRE